MGGCEVRPAINSFEDCLNLLWDKAQAAVVLTEKDNNVAPEIVEISKKHFVFGIKRKSNTYHLIGKLDSSEVKADTEIFYLKPLYEKKKKGEEGPGYIDAADKAIIKIIAKDGLFTRQ